MQHFSGEKEAEDSHRGLVLVLFWTSSGCAVNPPSKLVVISLNIFRCISQLKRGIHSLPSKDNFSPDTKLHALTIHTLHSKFNMATPNRVSESLSGEGTDPSKQRCLWHFASTSLGDLRKYYTDFPWNDYCFCVRDPSLCAERITEVIVSGMEVYIPHSFSQPQPSKPSKTQPVLVLYMIERLPTKGTSAYHHLNLVHFIFLHRIMPSLFFNFSNTPS
ncbi:hypothetical protein E2C01_012907 [Portunus trituberculatus]|uniref:Uncharacterized protein n=1 Tax=Portunus trituberculatus TaxID=210409 RepID=A0A5B7DFP4_PORTR|nr:hypothetical protein [Portunus trituberculatus]